MNWNIYNGTETHARRWIFQNPFNDIFCRKLRATFSGSSSTSEEDKIKKYGLHKFSLKTQEGKVKVLFLLMIPRPHVKPYIKKSNC